MRKFIVFITFVFFMISASAETIKTKVMYINDFHNHQEFYGGECTFSFDGQGLLLTTQNQDFPKWRDYGGCWEKRQIQRTSSVKWSDTDCLKYQVLHQFIDADNWQYDFSLLTYSKDGRQIVQLTCVNQRGDTPVKWYFMLFDPSDTNQIINFLKRSLPKLF